MAFQSHSVKRSHSAEGESVARAENGRNHQGVDDVREDANAHILHGDHIGRTVGGSRASILQGFVVMRQNDTDAL